jgi:outer membrane biosynthesis protein TonB
VSPKARTRSPPIDCLMPASETPTNPPIPAPEAEEPRSASTAVEESYPESADSEEAGSEGNGRRSPRQGYSTSRYVDYDAHELLEKISQYEDERRWQRIREGIWISIIAHFLFFAALYFIPRYVFHQTQLIDPIQAIKDRKDLTYLDELPDALKQVQKAKPRLKPNETQVDKKTLDALKALEKARPKPTPPPPAPEEQARNTPPPAPVQPQPETTPAPASNAPPVPSPQIPQEAPRPAPVPARPNFSLGPQNPNDQLRQAMRGSQSGQSGEMRGGPLAQHPGAGGGAQIISDTQGVDFSGWLQKAVRETHRAWDPIIPEEVNPPILKRGEVEIVFTVLPNGRVQSGSMMLTGRSGDVALDRAAWGGIVGADYPPLPSEFHGPNIQLRFRFMYNVH